MKMIEKDFRVRFSLLLINKHKILCCECQLFLGKLHYFEKFKCYALEC